MDHNPPPQLMVTMMSNPLFLSGARELVSAVARRFGFGEESCGQVALAVDEALCNVIRHGYGRAPDKPIWIGLWPLDESGEVIQSPRVDEIRDAAAIRIVIEDEAKQVDPGQIKSRELEDIRPGGLGVHIIQTVMDEVQYSPRDSSGMRLTMVKRRGGGSGDNDTRSASMASARGQMREDVGLGKGREGCDA